MEALERFISHFRNEVIRSGIQDQSKIKTLGNDARQLGDKAVQEISALFKNGEFQVREAAADLLEEIGSEAAMDALVTYGIENLNDERGTFKLPGAGWVRLRTAGRKILPALARAYKAVLPVKTRLNMIHIAHQIGGVEALQLLEIALKETDPRLIQAAAEALGRVGGGAAYSRLVQLLFSDIAQVRFGAIQGLQLLGNPKAIRPLLKVLLVKDYPIQQWWSGRDAIPLSLHRAAAEVIDALACQSFNGDIDSIQQWFPAHHACSRAASSSSIRIRETFNVSSHCNTIPARCRGR